MAILRGDALLAIINRAPYREYRLRDLMPDGQAELPGHELLYDQLKNELERMVRTGYVRRKEIGGVPFYYSVRMSKSV
jgi:hypothetical protein